VDLVHESWVEKDRRPVPVVEATEAVPAKDQAGWPIKALANDYDLMPSGADWTDTMYTSRTATLAHKGLSSVAHLMPKTFSAL
jgi:hypothetical protein